MKLALSPRSNLQPNHLKKLSDCNLPQGYEKHRRTSTYLPSQENPHSANKPSEAIKKKKTLENASLTQRVKFNHQNIIPQNETNFTPRQKYTCIAKPIDKKNSLASSHILAASSNVKSKLSPTSKKKPGFYTTRIQNIVDSISINFSPVLQSNLKTLCEPEQTTLLNRFHTCDESSISIYKSTDNTITRDDIEILQDLKNIPYTKKINQGKHRSMGDIKELNLDLSNKKKKSKVQNLPNTSAYNQPKKTSFCKPSGTEENISLTASRGFVTINLCKQANIHQNKENLNNSLKKKENSNLNQYNENKLLLVEKDAKSPNKLVKSQISPRTCEIKLEADPFTSKLESNAFESPFKSVEICNSCLLPSQYGSFVEGKQLFIEGKQSFIESKQSFIEGKQSFVEGKQSFVEGKQSFVEGKQSFMNEKQSFVEGKLSFVEAQQSFAERKQSFVEGNQFIVERKLSFAPGHVSPEKLINIQKDWKQFIEENLQLSLFTFESILEATYIQYWTNYLTIEQIEAELRVLFKVCEEMIERKKAFQLLIRHVDSIEKV